MPSPFQSFNTTRGIHQDSAGTTLNATAARAFTIGSIVWQDLAASKTFSAVGGGIFLWVTATGVTFANVASVFDVGIQDVGSDGLPDGTFDVVASFIGGTDTITSSTIMRKAFTSGSKTVNFGDKVAIGAVFTNRAGADAVSLDRFSFSNGGDAGFPYSVIASTRGNDPVVCALKADDGTWCYILQCNPLYNVAVGPTATATFGSGSNPNEYGGAITFGEARTIYALTMEPTSLGSADSFDISAWSGSLASPSLITSKSFTGSNQAVSDGFCQLILPTPYDLDAGDLIIISIKATSVNALGVTYFDLGSANADLKEMQVFASAKFVSRNGGAFSEVQTYYLPDIQVTSKVIAAVAASENNYGVAQ